MYLTLPGCAHDPTLPAVHVISQCTCVLLTQLLPAVAQPLIPVATVLEGALLGALDTAYIAKRTGLGIAIALATIYASQHVFHMGLLGIWVRPQSAPALPRAMASEAPRRAAATIMSMPQLHCC